MKANAINLMTLGKILFFFGASMGGMVSQLMAVHCPERVLSLTAIMSTSGDRHLPRARLPLIWKLFKPRPNPENPEAAFDHLLSLCRSIGSPKYPEDETELRRRIATDLGRCYCPEGIGRQVAAVVSAPPRTHLLKEISTPSLVIHGTADPVLPYAHGIDLARAIPNARLDLIDGMGHNVPATLVPKLTTKLLHHLRTARRDRTEIGAAPSHSAGTVA